MSEYDFTLILFGITDFTDDQVDSLFDAGCDDATVAQRSGRVYMTFSRDAQSMTEAIISAIVDIRKANIGAGVLRVDTCNLVNQSEIARRLGLSRQCAENYVNGKRLTGFPAPACNIIDGQPLYFWSEVAYWACENSLLRQDANREAQEIAILNNIIELEHQKRIEPELTAKMLSQFSVCKPCEEKSEQTAQGF